MRTKELSAYRQQFSNIPFSFYTDIFTKAIWGDMGEDTASVTITIENDYWHMHFIRTQSGEPYPLSDTVCNIIDEYEKDLSDDRLYEFLALHGILQEFANYVNTLKR